MGSDLSALEAGHAADRVMSHHPYPPLPVVRFWGNWWVCLAFVFVPWVAWEFVGFLDHQWGVELPEGAAFVFGAAVVWIAREFHEWQYRRWYWREWNRHRVG